MPSTAPGGAQSPTVKQPFLQETWVTFSQTRNVSPSSHSTTSDYKEIRGWCFGGCSNAPLGSPCSQIPHILLPWWHPGLAKSEEALKRHGKQADGAAQQGLWQCHVTVPGMTTHHKSAQSRSITLDAQPKAYSLPKGGKKHLQQSTGVLTQTRKRTQETNSPTFPGYWLNGSVLSEIVLSTAQE